MGIAVVYNLFLTKGVSFIRSIRLKSKIKHHIGRYCTVIVWSNCHGKFFRVILINSNNKYTRKKKNRNS